jgi:hypothetical protein
MELEYLVQSFNKRLQLIVSHNSVGLSYGENVSNDFEHASYKRYNVLIVTASVENDSNPRLRKY